MRPRHCFARLNASTTLASDYPLMFPETGKQQWLLWITKRERESSAFKSSVKGKCWSKHIYMSPVRGQRSLCWDCVRFKWRRLMKKLKHEHVIHLSCNMARPEIRHHVRSWRHQVHLNKMTRMQKHMSLLNISISIIVKTGCSDVQPAQMSRYMFNLSFN